MVRQTSCRYCGQDIEGFSPYRKGEWRDRGNNTHCNDGNVHAPYIDRHPVQTAPRGPVSPVMDRKQALETAARILREMTTRRKRSDYRAYQNDLALIAEALMQASSR